MGAGVGNWDEINWEEYVPPGDLSGHQAQLLQDLGRRQRTENENTPASLLVVGWRPESLISSTVEPPFDRHVELNAMLMRIALAQSGSPGSTE